MPLGVSLVLELLLASWTLIVCRGVLFRIVDSLLPQLLFNNLGARRFASIH